MVVHSALPPSSFCTSCFSAASSAASPAGGKASAKAPTTPGPAAGGNPSVRELKGEIAQREKELGKQHPDVAVALTDLAALHSEEEQFAAAQPLSPEPELAPLGDAATARLRALDRPTSSVCPRT